MLQFAFWFLITFQASFSLQEGDLLFQDIDCGPFCDAIEKVTTGYKGANFSHIGIVIRNEEGQLEVIEANGKGVNISSIDSFLVRSLDNDNNPKVVVGRLTKKMQHLIPDAIELSKTKLGASYDDIFDINNNTYYCSELVYESFKNANDGVDVFKLFPMTFIDPDTNQTFGIWADYYKELKQDIPEGKPGLNPGGISRSQYIDIVHYYGVPSISLR